MESALRAGFCQHGSGWSWGKDSSVPCLSEQEALSCFITALREEKEISGSEGIALISPRHDATMAVLISALADHNLLDSFLEVVDGLGDLEELAAARNIIFASSGLQSYEEYYLKHFKRQIDLSNPQTVPKMIYQVLECMLSSTPSYANFLCQHAHPVISPYTAQLLHHSQILQLREDYHQAIVTTSTILQPATPQIVSLHLNYAPKTDIGKEFFMLWRLRQHTKVQDNTNIRKCHYFNNNKVCPFEHIGCKFKHEKSEHCANPKNCKVKLCPKQHSLI